MAMKKYQFDYTNDAICFTPPVHTFKELLEQRLRWKLGCFKAVTKYRKMIFNEKTGLIYTIQNFFKTVKRAKTGAKYSFNLSWWKLPKIWVEELLMFITLLLSCFVLFFIAKYGNFSTYISIILIYGPYSFFSFVNEDKMALSEKIGVTISIPFTFIFLELISIVEYISLIRCILNPQKLLEKESKWVHVER